MPKKVTNGEAAVRPKRFPVRVDGQRTRNAILAAAAELLNESGFDGLSTNLICARAGLTAPALYRYYPNKYAVLFDIAHELLIFQLVALREWLSDSGFSWTTLEGGVASVDRLQGMMQGVADRQVGAIWIMRAMRSIPMLREVWLVARETMTNDLREALAKRLPWLETDDLTIAARFLDETIDLSTHLALDHPTSDRAKMARTVSIAVVHYIDALEQPPVTDEDEEEDDRG